RVIPAPGPDVGDDVALFQGQEFQQLLRVFLFLALRALQPCGREVPHHLGDLAAHVELADPVAVVLRPPLVTAVLAVARRGVLVLGVRDRWKEQDRGGNKTGHGLSGSGGGRLEGYGGGGGRGPRPPRGG